MCTSRTRPTGAPRVTAELNDGSAPDDRVNHKRIARVMREHGIAGVRPRRRARTTVPEPADQKVADLLERDFTASEPNRKYVGDIAEGVRTRAGAEDADLYGNDAIGGAT